jgi:hypothetical membrane protein
MTTKTLIRAATPPAPRRPDRATRVLLRCGAVAGPLFVAVFLIEGATRAGYDPLRHPVSSLALGPHGWVQTTNFVVCGLLTLAYAVGLRRASKQGARPAAWGPALVGVWALGLLAAGAFRTDPVSGYPPGTPDLPPSHTFAGAVHDGAALVGFAALAVAFVVYGWRFARQRRPGWAAYTALTTLVFLAAVVLSSAGFGQNAALVDLAGLFQRVAVIAALTWLTLLAAHHRAGSTG